MKKVLFLLVSLVAVVCTMTTLTSCAEEISGVVVNIVSGMGLDESAVSQETYDNALASKKRMDARLQKMFGKEFVVECEEHTLPEVEDFIPHSERIGKDPEIRKEIEYLSTLKTIDGNQAVSYVVFHYMTGEHELTYYVIEL